MEAILHTSSASTNSCFKKKRGYDFFKKASICFSKSLIYRHQDTETDSLYTVNIIVYLKKKKN